MKIAFDVLKDYDFACLMGDFNFDNLIEDSRIDADFEDLWKVFHDINKNQGFTMPENRSYLLFTRIY